MSRKIPESDQVRIAEVMARAVETNEKYKTVRYTVKCVSVLIGIVSLAAIGAWAYLESIKPSWITFLAIVLGTTGGFSGLFQIGWNVHQKFVRKNCSHTAALEEQIDHNRTSSTSPVVQQITESSDHTMVAEVTSSEQVHVQEISQGNNSELT